MDDESKKFILILKETTLMFSLIFGLIFLLSGIVRNKVSYIESLSLFNSGFGFFFVGILAHTIAMLVSNEEFLYRLNSFNLIKQIRERPIIAVILALFGIGVIIA